jgi:hypothetical protein
MVFENWWEIFPPIKELSISMGHFLMLDQWRSSQRLLDLRCDFGEADVLYERKNVEKVFLKRS